MELSQIFLFNLYNHPRVKREKWLSTKSRIGRHNTLLQAFDSISCAHLILVHYASIQRVLYCVASTMWLMHPASKTDNSPCSLVSLAWHINNYLQSLSTFYWKCTVVNCIIVQNICASLYWGPLCRRIVFPTLFTSGLHTWYSLTNENVRGSDMSHVSADVLNSILWFFPWFFFLS